MVIVRYILVGVTLCEAEDLASFSPQFCKNYVNIAEYLKEPNKRNHAYGYKWKYKETVN